MLKTSIRYLISLFRIQVSEFCRLQDRVSNFYGLVKPAGYGTRRKDAKGSGDVLGPFCSLSVTSAKNPELWVLIGLGTVSDKGLLVAIDVSNDFEMIFIVRGRFRRKTFEEHIAITVYRKLRMTRQIRHCQAFVLVKGKGNVLGELQSSLTAGLLQQ